MEIPEFAFASIEVNVLTSKDDGSHEELSFKKYFLFELQRQKIEHMYINMHMCISECVYIFIHVYI